MRLCRFLVGVIWGGAMLAAAPVWAQDSLAYVLVTTQSAKGEMAAARADGVALSRGLIAAGVSTIRRENADPAVFSFGAVAPLTLLYFSGPTQVQDGETWLLAPGAAQAGARTATDRPEGWPLGATIRMLKDRGALQVVAVVQGCHRPGPDFAAPPPPLAATPTAPPEPVPAAQPAAVAPPVDPLDDTLILLSADPAVGCPETAPTAKRLTDRVLAALAGGGDDLARAIADQPGEGWADMRLRHRVPVPVVQAKANTPDALAARAALLRTLPPEQAAQLAALWTRLEAGEAAIGGAVGGAAGGGQGTRILAPGEAAAPPDTPDPTPQGPNAPAALANRRDPGSSPVAPVPAVATAPSGSRAGLRIVEVSARVLLAARPTLDGLPRPSVIVGELASRSAFVPGADLPASAPAATLFGMAAPERAAMRGEDASRFATLVESGAFDPPPEQVAASIQTELQRMNCYTARIDGSWGAGSRAAVDRYYSARSAPAPSREATLVLYRDIVAAADVACPALAQAAPAAPRRAAPATGTTTARRAAPAAAAPAARAPAAPRATGGIDAGALGRGVMR